MDKIKQNSDENLFSACNNDQFGASGLRAAKKWERRKK